MQNISKLFTRKTCYQNMLGKYIKVFKSCASLTLNRMHVVYWKNNKQQHRVQLQIFPTVETQVIFEVFFSKLCSKFGACKCGNRGLGLGSVLAPTSLISTSSRVIGDPPKGTKGEGIWKYANPPKLSKKRFGKYGHTKQNFARNAIACVLLSSWVIRSKTRIYVSITLECLWGHSSWVDSRYVVGRKSKL